MRNNDKQTIERKFTQSTADALFHIRITEHGNSTGKLFCTPRHCPTLLLMLARLFCLQRAPTHSPHIYIYARAFVSQHSNNFSWTAAAAAVVHPSGDALLSVIELNDSPNRNGEGNFLFCRNNTHTHTRGPTDELTQQLTVEQTDGQRNWQTAGWKQPTELPDPPARSFGCF